MTTIGIIGAGQLGQMLGIAGQKMGLKFIFLDPSDNPPAAVAGPVLQYPFDSEEGLAELVAKSDIVTYEFENVAVAAIEKIAATTTVYPPAEALRHAQDRLVEKTLFTTLGIPVAEFRAVDTEEDLRAACTAVGLPLVLKTRRLGYDGKGQSIVKDEADIGSAFAELGGSDLIAEQWIEFDREVSAIAARNVSGDVVFYPLTENSHRQGILSVSKAPVEADELTETANHYVTSLLTHLNYVGVLTLELFVVGNRLLANEIAPRVHNSGHCTIEGATTSQFENHLRAILDMPLGDANAQGYAGMINLLGEMPDKATELQEDNCFVHDYGKQPRPGRKLGHVTVVADTPAAREERLKSLGKLLII
jgi:5-(carboxyamino)imidazole ribonucleotide synthase